MISYEDALKMVLDAAEPDGAERLFITEAVDRVLAEDVLSPIDIPATDNSAMDGYAVRFEDIKDASPDSPAELKVVGEAPAGVPFTGAVSAGEAVSIYTGAVIPDGADTVVEVEATRREGQLVRILQARPRGADIRKRGEDVKAGETVFAAGTRLTPPVIGVLASIGNPRIKVYRAPVVAVVSTGSELIEIDEEYSPGRVRNSNTYLLEALLSGMPVKKINFGVVPDDRKSLRKTFKDALAAADVLLTTGGVSVGEYDLVKDLLEEEGFDRVFWKVAQKPGKPLAFYRRGDRFVFGLPGNPAAVQICFLEYVRPFLLKKLGYPGYLPVEFKARLVDGHRKKPGRLNFIRVFLKNENGTLNAYKAGAQGSGVLSTSARANAVALIPAEVTEVKPGEAVAVHYFDDVSW